MTNPTPTLGKWTERPSVLALGLGQGDSMFELLFERSADAIWLFDPRTGVFVDCNQAAVDLMRAGTKEKLLQLRPEDLSPPVQPDGTPSGGFERRVRDVGGHVQPDGGLARPDGR